MIYRLSASPEVVINLFSNGDRRMQAQRVCLCVSGCVCVCVRWLLQLKCEMMPSVTTMFVMLLLCYGKMKAVCVCVYTRTFKTSQTQQQSEFILR